MLHIYLNLWPMSPCHPGPPKADRLPPDSSEPLSQLHIAGTPGWYGMSLWCQYLSSPTRNQILCPGSFGQYLVYVGYAACLGCERLMPLINYLVILVRLVVRAPSVLVVILAILVLLVLMFFRVILWSSWWLRSSGLPDSSLSYLMWLPRQLMCSWTASCSALGHIVLCSRVANPRLAPTGQPEADQKATIQG